jgi:soluble cytochrome b562
VGFLAIAMLFKLPALPNCPAIFWPMASASLRLSCAQIAANKQTINDLLEAIKLVNSLPANHPLRAEADRLTEQWSQDILRLAEVTFQEGKMPDAINAVRQIPKTVPAYALVEAQVQRWQKIWAEAEAIFEKAKAEMGKENYGNAFRQAVKLLSVGNSYWETVKYQELTKLIAVARAEGSKLVKARRLAEGGNLADLLAAIKLVESIPATSQLYAEAQVALGEIGRKMLDLAEANLNRKDLQGAIAIARKIPANAGIQAETEDFITLARARSEAWTDSVAGIEDAIQQAQKLTPGRPLYRKAQQFIARWQFEISDVTHLEQARELAQPGTIEAFAAAISEAENIPKGNPRWDEAQREIRRWTTQIQTIEDRPLLDEAEQVASAGDVLSLQAAIETARQIDSNRALYSTAQKKINTWTQQIQRIQDQPYLDQARALADSGNLPDAIAIARQIQPGRALYDQAQTDIRSWQSQVQGQQNLREAYRLANGGSPDALASAISAAQKVPTSSAARSEAESVIDQWSWQILETAKSQAGVDLLGAIATAQKVPPRTEAYAEAQLQISSWKKQTGQ